MREPLFTETLQVSIVVRDLDAAMRTYVHEYGIGPWDVYEFNPSTVSDMRHRGEPVAWSWRLAIAQVGQVQWELVEPLDDESIYAQFLATTGRVSITSASESPATTTRSSSSAAGDGTSFWAADTTDSRSRTSPRTTSSA